MIHGWLNPWCGTRGYEGQTKWTSVYISVTVKEYYTQLYILRKWFLTTLFIQFLIIMLMLTVIKKKTNEYNLSNLKYKKSTVPVDMMLCKP